MNETPFGRYRLVELLGRGGMGEVWRAYDTAANNRMVAIKLLPPHLAGDTTYLARFRREADAAARLNDPHVIPIHNYGEIKRVLELAAGAGTQKVLPFSGLDDPSGVAVGPGGDVYVTDHGTEQVVKLAAGTSNQEVLPFTGLEAPTGAAVDSTGNVYVTDDPQRTLKLPAG